MVAKSKKMVLNTFIILVTWREKLKMADELIDIFDEDMNLLGTAMKSQAHREGLWHKTFHCWLVQKTASGKIMLWLQLRNHTKDIFHSC